ncbi:MAG: hypothetical protein KJ000_30130 [Pirellulaceae bacterium]|nr:hypothetical protein [Pirellulaceae bacterium]
MELSVSSSRLNVSKYGISGHSGFCARPIKPTVNGLVAVVWRRSSACRDRERGYTFGMKTAISIPDDVFEEAERLADRLQTSRSQLYTRALAEFVARHDDDRVQAAMNAVIDEVGPAALDDFTREAARQTLRRVEW